MAGGLRDRSAHLQDVTTITLSYTFFEVGGRTPAAPTGEAPVAAGPKQEPAS